jgi:hypothetical protein
MFDLRRQKYGKPHGGIITDGITMIAQVINALENFTRKPSLK